MSAYWSDDAVTLHHGDCLDVMRELPDASVDSVVTDPPYDLTSKGGAAGFMGKAWDGTGIAFRPAVWQECLRVLKPGGHLLAFGGTRTWHRLAVAVEDAGFEIRDSIAWLYGSGFPKSLDVSKAIDKRPGVTRHAEFATHLTNRRKAKGLSRQQVALAVVGTATGACWNWEHHQFPEAKWWPALRDLLDMDDKTWGPIIAESEREITQAEGRPSVPGETITFDQRSSTERERRDIPATPAARQWSGWGTALKPAFEPCVVARKPLIGTVAANVTTHGTGALNIDGCRVGTSGGGNACPGGDLCTCVTSGVSYSPTKHPVRREGDFGRWPANVVLDENQAAEMDRQSGVLTSGKVLPHHADNGKAAGTLGAFPGAPGRETYGDSGGASRFFPTFRYEAKAPTEERPRVDGVAHPTVKPLDLMRWLVRLVTPPGGTVLEPFAGSGTTAEACVHEHLRCIAIEREAEYLPLIIARLTKPMEIGFDFEEAS